MNERELIARLQKRDEAAFEELIRQYEKKVYTLCFRMCGNSEDAEEAAQDTFLALWRGIDRFRQENFELQNSVQSDELFDRTDEFSRRLEEFRKNPLVDAFLNAELDFCRMIQEINGKIVEAVNFE